MVLIKQMLAEASELPVDRQIILPVERRQFLKRRWRFTAVDGTEFGFDLVSRLTNGCVIHHEDGIDYVVRQLPELVYQVPLRSPEEAAMIGWKTGNLHLPTQITYDAMLVLHDPAFLNLLTREGWPYSEVEVIFQPMKAMAHEA